MRKKLIKIRFPNIYGQIGKHITEIIKNEPKFRIIGVLFVFFMLLLSFERAAILLSSPNLFKEEIPSNLVKSFSIGLRFDNVISCMLLVPVLPILAFKGQWLGKKGLQRFISFACSVFLAIFLFACVADIFFFREFAERLNNKAIEYLPYGATYKLIWQTYPVLTIIAGSLIFALILSRVLGRLFFGRCNPKYAPGLFVTLCWMTVVIGYVVMGIRGTIGHRPINTGYAYFCDSTPVTQLTLNGFFTLREEILDIINREDATKGYDLLEETAAVKTVLDIITVDGDKFIKDPLNPLRRITDSKKPEAKYNVVLVMLESLSWQYIEAMGGQPGLTPNLNRLADEGILIDNCFAVSDRTARALGGVLSSFPGVPGDSALDQTKTNDHFLTFAKILKDRGYETLFIYGGQAIYDHMKSFALNNGFTQGVFEEQFNKGTFRTPLGYCDEDVYAKANEEFSSITNKPFFSLILTLSFHEPFRVPPGRVKAADPCEPYGNQLECIRYADWAIGDFLNKARREKYFDNTIFVFTADHMGGFLKSHSPDSFRIPLIIYAPKILEPKRVSTICSQIDIGPTIMGLLGGSYEHCFFGSDVLNKPADKGWAFLQSGLSISYINSIGEGVTVPRYSNPIFFNLTPANQIPKNEKINSLQAGDPSQMTKNAIALTQTAIMLLENNSYNISQDRKSEF